MHIHKCRKGAKAIRVSWRIQIPWARSHIEILNTYTRPRVSRINFSLFLLLFSLLLAVFFLPRDNDFSIRNENQLPRLNGINSITVLEFNTNGRISLIRDPVTIELHSTWYFFRKKINEILWSKKKRKFSTTSPTAWQKVPQDSKFVFERSISEIEV